MALSYLKVTRAEAIIGGVLGGLLGLPCSFVQSPYRCTAVPEAEGNKGIITKVHVRQLPVANPFRRRCNLVRVLHPDVS